MPWIPRKSNGPSRRTSAVARAFALAVMLAPLAGCSSLTALFGQSDEENYVEEPAENTPPWDIVAPGWYFWDEWWSERYGPYDTEPAVRKALETYARWLDGEDVYSAPYSHDRMRG